MRFHIAAALAAFVALPAAAQQAKPSAGTADYPNKSIRLVVPSSTKLERAAAG